MLRRFRLLGSSLTIFRFNEPQLCHLLLLSLFQKFCIFLLCFFLFFTRFSLHRLSKKLLSILHFNLFLVSFLSNIKNFDFFSRKFAWFTFGRKNTVSVRTLRWFDAKPLLLLHYWFVIIGLHWFHIFKPQLSLVWIRINKT